MKQAPFEKDDTLFFYTDGLLDGKDREGHAYGKKQVRKVIEDAISHDPQTLIDGLMSDFLAHNANKKLDDDVTLAVARVLA
ncbi:MAG: SpoIIE family protein phosphatase [Deltaproteobacteria bacterium]|nr:SpoIIE family protein phosphatase [Deltaproteobacteria bacterium]